MVIVYFSGTGNSRFVAGLFAGEMGADCYSIEDEVEDEVDFAALFAGHDLIAFCYPVYASRVPRILREFVGSHMEALRGKRIAIFCTQMLFSGDGARAFAALFPKNHVEVVYAEHFLMPNNVNNVAILPMASEKTAKKRMARAAVKMKKVCANIRRGKVKRRGFNPVSRVLGLPQGLLMHKMERLANKTLRIDSDCNQCGLCAKICPTKNLAAAETDGKITHNGNCTMCYRCLNKCPQRAINLFFRGKVKKQYPNLMK